MPRTAAPSGRRITVTASAQPSPFLPTHTGDTLTHNPLPLSPPPPPSSNPLPPSHLHHRQLPQWRGRRVRHQPSQPLHHRRRQGRRRLHRQLSRRPHRQLQSPLAPARHQTGERVGSYRSAVDGYVHEGEGHAVGGAGGDCSLQGLSEAQEVGDQGGGAGVGQVQAGGACLRGREDGVCVRVRQEAGREGRGAGRVLVFVHMRQAGRTRVRGCTPEQAVPRPCMQLPVPLYRRTVSTVRHCSSPTAPPAHRRRAPTCTCRRGSAGPGAAIAV